MIEPSNEQRIEFMRTLRNDFPSLFTMEVLVSKLIKDMDHGEIHLTAFVKGGKITRVEGFPKISSLVET